MRGIYNVEDIDKTQSAIKAFAVDYRAKYPKAVAKIVDDADVLLEHHRYPAEHSIHLQHTNPSSRPSPPSGCAPKSPRGPGHVPRKLPRPTC